MKLQKIKIELYLGDNTNPEMVIDLLERKYKKVKFHFVNYKYYLLKGMDKHRAYFIEELIDNDILDLSYKSREKNGEIEHYLYGIIKL